MKYIVALLLCFFSFYAIAQDNNLLIQGTSPHFYLNHTVAPKENFYSVGRMYNSNPKEIALVNNLPLEKGLNLGQTIKIPLSSSNFLQTGKMAKDEATVPLYYIVKEKEGLYRIGLNHNKLPVETLKKWNNINGDAVSTGTKLIVGYLKVKKGQPLPTDNSNTTSKAPSEKIEKTETPKEDIDKIETPKEKKDIPKEKDIEVTQPPVTEKDKAIDFKGGVFKKLFESQINGGKEAIKTEGTAGIFKSTSGWTDGKYYCLHNNASPGTVVKVTNTVTGKSIYAKVLDVMPDIKPNAALTICISNAAAAELGAGENNFNSVLNYSK